jgi:chitin synthase
MRYFAATGGPNGFQENGFTSPRQAHDNPLRRVELFNSRALSVVAARSAYQEGIVTNVVDGKPVAAHIYEYTTESTSHAA